MSKGSVPFITWLLQLFGEAPEYYNNPIPSPSKSEILQSNSDVSRYLFSEIVCSKTRAGLSLFFRIGNQISQFSSFNPQDHMQYSRSYKIK